MRDEEEGRCLHRNQAMEGAEPIRSEVERERATMAESSGRGGSREGVDLV